MLDNQSDPSSALLLECPEKRQLWIPDPCIHPLNLLLATSSRPPGRLTSSREHHLPCPLHLPPPLRYPSNSDHNIVCIPRRKTIPHTTSSNHLRSIQVPQRGRAKCAQRREIYQGGQCAWARTHTKMNQQISEHSLQGNGIRKILNLSKRARSRHAHIGRKTEAGIAMLEHLSGDRQGV